jgi:hypothetical protein
VTAAGNETFASWRENVHDDVVFACMLAVFAGERVPRQDPAARPGVVGRRLPNPQAEYLRRQIFNRGLTL